MLQLAWPAVALFAVSLLYKFATGFFTGKADIAKLEKRFDALLSREAAEKIVLQQNAIAADMIAFKQSLQPLITRAAFEASMGKREIEKERARAD